MMKIYLASRLHENSVSPSGNQETFVTISVWPRSSASVSPVKMSHTRSVRSAAAEARRRCRPLSASHLIGAKAPEKKNYKMIASKWVKNSVIIVSKMYFKILILKSVHIQDVTASVCPTSVRSSVPVYVVHTFSVLSLEHDATYTPSGEKQTSLIAPWCPSRRHPLGAWQKE